MSLHETLLCATQPAQGTGALTIHDVQTGAPLASFKHTSSAPRCTTFIPSTAKLGGVMIAAQADKAVLNVYSFQKDQVLLKCVLPERLTCVAVDRKGLLCAGGTAQGRVYLWELASGVLCNAWDAHYRQVTVLKFSHDGDVLASGGEDAGVSVWSVSRLLDEELRGSPVALSILSDHTLPVTDIAIGSGRFPSCRLVSVSTDCSVKLWDLSTNKLLTTFLLPRPLAHVVLDPTERQIFTAASGPEADIYQLNLFRKRDDRVEAIGGMGVSDIIRLNTEDSGDREAQKRRISVGEEITSLAFSLTSSLLLTGTALGSVHVYDVLSHQRLRSINIGSKVTEISAMLRPPDLFGHTSLVARERESIPVRPIAPLQRTKVLEKDGKEVNIVLAPVTKETAEALSDYPTDELERDAAFFAPSSESGKQATHITNARVTELEEEVERLRGQLGRAKGINDAMWGAMVQKVVTEGKDEDSAADGRAKKRGRKE